MNHPKEGYAFDGSYTAIEVGRLLRMPPKQVRNWAVTLSRPTKGGVAPSIRPPKYGNGNEGWHLNFENLIDMFAVKTLRKHGYSHWAIRHHLSFFHWRGELHRIDRIEIENTGQVLLGDGRAVKFYPWVKADGTVEKRIVCDPAMRHGAPTFAGTRMDTETLYLAYLGTKEDGQDEAQCPFELTGQLWDPSYSVEEVKLAVGFERWLKA